MTTRRALLAAAPVAALGLSVQACGPARRRTRYLAPSAVTGADPEPAPPPHDPWTATGGRLFGQPDEPCAPPGAWSFLAPRLRLWVPHWLRLGSPDWIARAEQEALAAELPDRPDLPACAVVIHDPVAFSVETAPGASILAAGLWWVYGAPSETWDVLRVAWGGSHDPQGRALPALAHEIGHRLTRDPCAGHPQPCA